MVCLKLPPSIQDWLPEKHLARFVVEIVEQLNLQPLKASYSGRGSQPYNPEMLVALLFYGYATGVFSSRKLERSTYDSVAFRYIAANKHPDHDTIAEFRKRFLPELTKIFVEILTFAHQMKVLKLGKVSIDGTKVKANASKHKALSYGHACKLEKQLEAEVAELLQKAESATTLIFLTAWTFLLNFRTAGSVSRQLRKPKPKSSVVRRNGMPRNKRHMRPKLPSEPRKNKKPVKRPVVKHRSRQQPVQRKRTRLI